MATITKGVIQRFTLSSSSGTVTSVSVTSANGVSGVVATATTTPAITLTLGAITPTSVNSVVLSGASTPTLAVTGTTTVSGTNTGDQTSVSGNAGTATALQTARSIGGTSFNGTADITVASATGGFAVSGGNLTVAGTETITSASATSFVIGANGTTNPVFAVDCSTSTVKNGVKITGAATAGTTAFLATSDSANGGLSFAAIGSGSVSFINAGSTRMTIATTQFTLGSFSADSTASSIRFSLTGVANSNLTASTNFIHTRWNLAQTQTHATGAITLQQDFLILGADHAAAASSTFTDVAVFSVQESTGASTNATITNQHGIYLGSVVLTGTKTNSYKMTLLANTGATTNYCLQCVDSTGANRLLAVRGDGAILLYNTVTTGGTTGNQTINKPSGTVNIAAAGSTVTVTNSLCTATSIVLATVRTNDTTALIKNVVPGSGSFVITMNANVTAETSIGFLIIN